MPKIARSSAATPPLASAAPSRGQQRAGDASLGPRGYPSVVARAVDRLRLAGVAGPYRLVLGTTRLPLSAAGAKKAIRFFSTSNVLWKARSSGRPVLMAVSCLPRGGEISSSISARTCPSDTSAIPGLRSNCICRRVSPSAVDDGSRGLAVGPTKVTSLHPINRRPLTATARHRTFATKSVSIRIFLKRERPDHRVIHRGY
jgi:hypothetical protein